MDSLAKKVGFTRFFLVRRDEAFCDMDSDSERDRQEEKKVRSQVEKRNEDLCLAACEGRPVLIKSILF